MTTSTRQMRRRSAFTLIELLVVIGIIAVLMVIAVPAFKGIGQSSGMQAAVADLRATINLARQWAITHRTSTYVLFPGEHTPIGLATYSGSQVEKAKRTFAVYSAADGYISDWKILPAGIVFDDSFVTGSTVFASYNPASGFASRRVQVPWPKTSSITSNTFPCMAFGPTGNPKYLSGAYVLLRDGYITVNTNTGSIDDYFVRGDGPGFELRLSPVVGATKIRDVSG